MQYDDLVLELYYYCIIIILLIISEKARFVSVWLCVIKSEFEVERPVTKGSKEYTHWGNERVDRVILLQG